jgi:hypothetical protein
MSDLMSCPFCGAGETELIEYPRTPAPRMDGKPFPVTSAEIRHWCKRPDRVVIAIVRFRGRDLATVISAWNRHARELMGPDARVLRDTYDA